MCNQGWETLVKEGMVRMVRAMEVIRRRLLGCGKERGMEGASLQERIF